MMVVWFAAAVIAAVIAARAIQALRRSRWAARLLRADQVAEQMAWVATSCEDIDRLRREDGWRSGGETIARVSAVIAEGNIVLKKWALAAERTSHLGHHAMSARLVQTELDAVRARMLHEVEIDRATP